MRRVQDAHEQLLLRIDQADRARDEVRAVGARRRCRRWHCRALDEEEEEVGGIRIPKNQKFRFKLIEKKRIWV